MNPDFRQRRGLIRWCRWLWFVWLAAGLHYTTLADELQARPNDTIRATFGERETSAKVAGAPQVIGVRILGRAEDDTLVIGQVFRIEVAFDRPPGEEAISVVVSLGEQSLTVNARRFSMDPPLYESEPIQLVRGGQDGESRTLVARHGAMEDQAPVDGLTWGALADYLAELAVKAAEAETALEAALLSQEIAALLEGIDNPAILEFVADTLQSLMPHSAHPPSLELVSRAVSGRRDALLNNALEERLSVLAQGIEGGTIGERKAMALLKEAALVNALQQLARLSQFKRGEGLIADTSFMALSAGKMMERLRTLPETALTEFLATNGVAANEDYRKALRDLMVDASVKLQQYENELELNRKARARGFDDLRRNELNSEQWMRERIQLEGERAAIETERERLFREIPILRLRGQEVMLPDREIPSDAPLWKSLAFSWSPAKSQRLIDAAFDRSEQSIAAFIKRFSTLNTVEQLSVLGNPRYEKVHSIARGLAPKAENYTNIGIGKFQVSELEEQEADLVWTILQTAGALPGLQPLGVVATGVQIYRKGGQTLATFEDIEHAQTEVFAGIVDEIAVDNARHKFYRTAGELALETLSGAAEVGSTLAAMRATKRGLAVSGRTALRETRGVEAARRLADTAEETRAIARSIRETDARAAAVADKATGLERRIALWESRAEARARDIKKLRHELDALEPQAKLKEQSLTERLKNNQENWRAAQERLDKARNRNAPPEKIAELEGTVRYHEKLIQNRRKDIRDLWQKLKKEQQIKRRQLGKQEATRDGHRQRLERRAAELAALRRTGAVPQGRTRLAKALEGQAVEKAATVDAFEGWVGRYPGVEKLGHKRYQLGGVLEGRVHPDGMPLREFEYQFNKKIVDPEGKALTQPRTVEIDGEVLENPHAGQEMFFDRIVIDHRNKKIYLDDIVRSANREHLIKTYGYASQLGKMFPGYRVMPPKDTVYSTMEAAVAAIAPALRKVSGG